MPYRQSSRPHLILLLLHHRTVVKTPMTMTSVVAVAVAAAAELGQCSFSLLASWATSISVLSGTICVVACGSTGMPGRLDTQRSSIRFPRECLRSATKRRRIVRATRPPFRSELVISPTDFEGACNYC